MSAGTTYFQNLLDAGDLQLLQYLGLQTRWQGHSPLTAYLPPEWRDPVVVIAVIDQLGDDQRTSAFPPGTLPAMPAQPTPEQRRQATELYTRYFAASAPLRRSDPQAGEDVLRGTQRLLSLDRHRCDETTR